MAEERAGRGVRRPEVSIRLFPQRGARV